MPSSEEASPEVTELARRRRDARAARNFAEADRLRDEVTAAGWVITDTRDGFDVTRAAPAVETFPDYRSVPSLLDRPPLTRHGVCVAYYGWPEDLERLLDGVLQTAKGPTPALEMMVAVAGGAEPPPPVLAEVAHPALARSPVVTRVDGGLGHAEALNVAARRARSEFIHFTEPGVLLTWDVLEQAAQTLTDPAVGACGPFGLSTSDWREFHPAETGAVMALEYLVSVRHSDIPAIGEMDTGFRFYRNLDIDYSLQVVAAGFALRWYKADVERGIHRLWEATPAADRERLSRRNFNRLLDRWVRRDAPGS